ncbi:MAG: PAS domain S-box protein, partial [Termitinemataceae bacterium]
MMIEQLPIPVYVKNQQGTYIDCNTSFTQLLGREKADILQHTDYDLFPRSLADALFYHESELIKQSNAHQFESWLFRSDGNRRQVRIQQRLEPYPPCEEPCIIAVVIDITEEIQHEKERSSSLVTAAAAEMAIQTIEGMIDPVIILDRNGRVERVNKGYIDVIGSARESLGKQLSQVLAGVSQSQIEDLLRRCQVEGRIRNMEAHLQDRHGKLLPVLVNISKLRDSQQAIDGYVVAIRDVSSLVEAAEQVQKNQRKLDALLNASHDAIMLLSTDGTIVSGNRALSESCQQPLDKIIGKKYSDLSDGSVRQIKASFISNILEAGVPQHI